MTPQVLVDGFVVRNKIVVSNCTVTWLPNDILDVMVMTLRNSWGNSVSVQSATTILLERRNGIDQCFLCHHRNRKFKVGSRARARARERGKSGEEEVMKREQNNYTPEDNDSLVSHSE